MIDFFLNVFFACLSVMAITAAALGVVLLRLAIEYFRGDDA